MWLIIFSIELHVLSCAISLFRLCFSPWFCIICFACNCLWSLMLFFVFSRSYCNLCEDLMKTEHAVMFLIDSNSVFQIFFQLNFRMRKFDRKKKKKIANKWNQIREISKWKMAHQEKRQQRAPSAHKKKLLNLQKEGEHELRCVRRVYVCISTYMRCAHCRFFSRLAANNDKRNELLTS